MTTEKKKKKKIEINDEEVRSHFHIICSCSCLVQDTEDIEPVPDSEMNNVLKMQRPGGVVKHFSSETH